MPKFLWRARSWRISEAGVIGYALRNSGSFDWTLAATSPSPSAWLPVTFRYVPGSSSARGDLVLRDEALARLAERVARAECARVRLGDLGPLGELLLEELDRALGRACVEPRHQPEREHVLRALGLALRDVDLLQLLERERGQRHLVDVVGLERVVLERAHRVAGLLEVPLREGIGVEDQRAARRQVLQVRAQRRGVHGDEDVRRVARRQDVVVREVDLEARHAGQRPRRRPDLGREVGQRREVVSEQRGLAREAPAGQLHPVAGVARKADDHLFQLLDGLGHDLCSEV